MLVLSSGMSADAEVPDCLEEEAAASLPAFSLDFFFVLSELRGVLVPISLFDPDFPIGVDFALFTDNSSFGAWLIDDAASVATVSASVPAGAGAATGLIGAGW